MAILIISSALALGCGLASAGETSARQQPVKEVRPPGKEALNSFPNSPARQRRLVTIVENDLWGGTDEHYTSGVEGTWISGVAPGPWLLANGWFVSAGQQIFTPSDVYEPENQLGDRPYAGWLYLKGGVFAQGEDELEVYSMDLGVTGEYSLGEEFQDAYHEWRDLREPAGWEDQLSTEVAFSLNYQRFARLWEFGAVDAGGGMGGDLIWNSHGSLGTLAIEAGGGLELRAGWNLSPDFGRGYLRRGLSVPPPTFDKNYNQDLFSAHLFLLAQGKGVARNLFLDGNTFSGSRSVDKRWVVGEFGGGIAFRIGGFTMSFTEVYRTEEFEGQDGGQWFGSLTGTWDF